MPQLKPICTDPSHPPIIGTLTQETLYEEVSESIANHQRVGASRDEIIRLVSGELIPRLRRPSSSVQEGYRLQQMREQIARDWGDVLYRVENLGHLAGWFINDCQAKQGISELHFVLCLLAFEAVRNVFAIVSQVRSALPQDAFVHLRTLHETLVKSRFLKKFSGADPDLPVRLAYYTNTKYLEFYRRFAPSDDEHALDNMWAEAERYYEVRSTREGSGDYGWAHPLIPNKRKAEPKKRPEFRDLVESVGIESDFWRDYYDVSTAKSHGQLIWNPLIVVAEGIGVSVDGFTVGNIGLVMDLMVPLYEEILEIAVSYCASPEHAMAMEVVRAVIADIRESAEVVKASNPSMHRGLS